MKNIGLDFGTTNSAISFFDHKHNILDCYRTRNAGSSFIPSLVGFEKDEASIEIGQAARSCQSDNEFDVFCGFKMLLGLSNSEQLGNYGYIEKTPDECAKVFIQQLIDSYCKEKNNSESIDNLVITVPEIWIKEHRHASREVLKKICNDLNLPLKKIISEPVAASVYFVYNYKKEKQSWFNGHVMVCDYGGGTLDLSLTKVEAERITVLECTGKGQVDELFGKAGVAFDHEVVTQVFKRHKEKPLSRSHKKYFRLIEDFEKQKIFKKDSIDKKLTTYLRNEKIDKKLVVLDDGIECKPSDLVDAFNKIIKPDLIKALEEMKKYMIKHNVDYANPDEFRVVMAGGFSSFYLVQDTIKKFFESETSTDQRFETYFDIEETSLAIAKGAALVANDMFNIDPVCPISVGVKAKTIDGDGCTIVKDIPILQKGIQLSQYKDPVFLKGGFYVNIDPLMRKTRLILFLGDNNERQYIKLDKGFDYFFANIQLKDNRWKIGFSVNEDLIFTMHTQDKKEGQKKEVLLGDLLERISGLIYSEEKI